MISLIRGGVENKFFELFSSSFTGCVDSSALLVSEAEAGCVLDDDGDEEDVVSSSDSSCA